MRILVRLLLGLIILAASGALTAHAGGIIVGNLGQPPDTTDPPQQIIPYLPQFEAMGVTAGQQFTTGTAATTISEVFATLGKLDLGTSKGFDLTAGLYSDNTSQGNSIPGTLLASFTYSLASIPTSGFANIEFDTSKIALSSNTNYWFVLGATNTSAKSTDSSFGSVTWAFTLSTSTYGPGQLPLTNETFNNLWSNDSASPNFTPAFPNEPFLVQFGAVAVPEPGSWVLACFGFTAALAVARVVRSRP
jgi:hypothetical protein